MMTSVPARSPLNCHSEPVDGKPNILFIHGWAATHLIWAEIFEQLQSDFNLYSFDLPGFGDSIGFHCVDEKAFMHFFEQHIFPSLPERVALVGWSLGGALATQIAACYPLCVTRLDLVASNPIFVARADWPQGLSEEALNAFECLSDTNVQAIVRRFWALQTLGDLSPSSSLRWLKRQLGTAAFSAQGLNAGLELLRSVDNLSTLAALKMPVVHHFGQKDTVVPIEVADRIANNFSTHTVVRYKHSAHLPFYSEKDKWLNQLQLAIAD